MAAPEACELPRDLVFVDLETTGGDAARDRITEVAIVRMHDGVVLEEWSSLVNPERLIPAYIESFTGITNEMAAAAPRFAEISGLVLEKIQAPRRGAAAPVFVAHNARFDYGFLRAEFRRLSVHFSARVLCTVKLSRRLYPEHARHNLDAVMERHGLTCSARHRALGDAQVVADLWSKLLREWPGERLAAVAESLLATVRLPAQLPPGLAEELPEGPGVYRFYGAEDLLLHVGRSLSIRAGVVKSLGNERGAGRDRKLREAVRRIDWEETAGELGAQLRELDYLRSQAPLVQRPGKRQTDGITIRIEAADGSVQMQPISEVPSEHLEDCLGVFNSMREARKALSDIAAAHRLCPKILGLEESAGSCLGYQLGACKGACAGQEPLALHAVRAQLALAALKLKPWPFPGRIMLRERRGFGAEDLHVLDRWRHVGSARSEDELPALAARPLPMDFDVQVYKILSRYLANHPRLEWHRLEAAPPVRDDGAYSLVDVS